MDFSTHQTQLLRPPPFQWMPLPDRVSDRDAWEQYIRRSINLYYRCGAVKSVQIGASRGQPWTIELHAGNRPEWIQSNTAAWAKQIQKACSFSMTPGPGELIVSAERGTQQASSGPARKAHSSSPGKARGGSSNVVSSPDKNQCVRRNLSKVSQVVAASVCVEATWGRFFIPEVEQFRAVRLRDEAGFSKAK